MKKENVIILNGKRHVFVQDKPKVDMCQTKCSLKEICYEHFEKDFLCSAFYNEKINNGHFELEKNE